MASVRGNLVLRDLSSPGRCPRLHGRALARTEGYVVGDTPRDIEAAHAADATAIGVASGHYTAQQLRAAKADYVLESLKEWECPIDGGSDDQGDA
ncbi:HAD family hydrolase [Streptomyces sp. NRRL S-813]|uniref:HAD family hydrolase n=1 Tax=Streptomyces sp. NRRL S-813 TaxID=1463919 RepID=UPI0018FF694C|nr:HAD hydrolase-like protein [Streptomyces sp. NRRL S-813]